MVKISIIVPVYKVEKYINRCIDSLLSQSYNDCELIIIDDGSPDGCSQIVDEYSKEFSNVIVIHQINGGLSDARNSGIKLASGEWITFIDSDDWVHPCYLKALCDGADAYQTSIAIGTYKAVDQYTTVEEEKYSCSLWNTEEYWVTNRTNATTAWGKLYKRELFNNIFFPTGKYHEDEYVTYRLLFQFDSVTVIDTPIYFYFCNAEGITGLNYLNRFSDALGSFQLHLDYFKKSEFNKAYRIEVEKYAECISEAIICLKRENRKDERIPVLRRSLKDFMSKHKSMIPFEKRKDIYISAYPSHEFFIRGFGWIKSIINGERK